MAGAIKNICFRENGFEEKWNSRLAGPGPTLRPRLLPGKLPKQHHQKPDPHRSRQHRHYSGQWGRAAWGWPGSLRAREPKLWLSSACVLSPPRGSGASDRPLPQGLKGQNSRAQETTEQPHRHTQALASEHTCRATLQKSNRNVPEGASGSISPEAQSRRKLGPRQAGWRDKGTPGETLSLGVKPRLH